MSEPVTDQQESILRMLEEVADQVRAHPPVAFECAVRNDAPQVGLAGYAVTRTGSIPTGARKPEVRSFRIEWAA